MSDSIGTFHGKLTTPQAAAFVGLGVSSLEKLRITGGGPAFLKIGRRVVYDARDLEQWLAKHKRPSTFEICAGEFDAADRPFGKSGSQS
jgi:predicted DNA-binding transcriptional regulator AlpA